MSQQLKVLIVDDAYFMRNLLKKALKEAGYDVVGEAKNGTEGIKLYFELKPDIVTMDINMPDISGIEVTKEILSKDPRAKIIAVTGNNDDGVKQEILNAGAIEYLQKPFQPAFLWTKLDKMRQQQEPEPTEGIPIAPPVSSESEGVEDDFENMDIEILNKPDESKSISFVIQNQEDVIEFPDQDSPLFEEELEANKLSTQYPESHETPVVITELEDNAEATGTGHIPSSAGEQLPTEPLDQSPPTTPRTPISASPSVTEPPAIDHQVEITRSRNPTRDLEEIDIRHQPAPINIRPPRGKILRDENEDWADTTEVEEPILNDSERGHYNTKNRGLLSRMKDLFKK